MWNFQEVFLIMLSLCGNLKLMSVHFIHETFLVYKLETFTNCKEVKHIMIMIIAIIYSFFIFSDIWSTVKNYFQKILSLPPPLPPLKNPTPLYTHSLTLKFMQVPPFLPILKIFHSPPFGGGRHYFLFSMNGLILPKFGLIK